MKLHPPAGPAWIACGCEDGVYYCVLHRDHVHDCGCPPVDEWPMSPYAEGSLAVAPFVESSAKSRGTTRPTLH